MSQKHTENIRKIEKLKENTLNSRKTLKNGEKHTKFAENALSARYGRESVK